MGRNGGGWGAAPPPRQTLAAGSLRAKVCVSVCLYLYPCHLRFGAPKAPLRARPHSLTHPPALQPCTSPALRRSACTAPLAGVAAPGVSSHSESARAQAPPGRRARVVQRPCRAGRGWSGRRRRSASGPRWPCTAARRPTLRSPYHSRENSESECPSHLYLHPAMHCRQRPRLSVCPSPSWEYGPGERIEPRAAAAGLRPPSRCGPGRRPPAVG